MPVMQVSYDGTEVIEVDRLELFARIIDGRIRPGWAVVGNEFAFSAEMPWQVRWRGLKGSAKEKLAAFDPKLAAELEQRKLTLAAAKKLLLQRECEAFANIEVASFEKATAPHLGLVPRFSGRVNCFLILKCTCGAKWERLTYFACQNWYWVHCPTCDAQHSFRMLAKHQWFESKPTPFNEHADIAMNACIPIRELENAA